MNKELNLIDNWTWLTYEELNLIDIWTKLDWHMIHSFASLICVMWYEQLHSANRICCSYQSIFTFDFWFAFMNVVSWHRNIPPVNSNSIHVCFHVLVIWIQSSRVSVTRNNIHEYKSEVKCENWLIWTTNSVLWMQLFISHHTNERSEWVQLNKYQIQFLCQSNLVLCSYQSNSVLCSYVNQNTQQALALPEKEVIQPHLPVRLPCYDFTPVTSPAFGTPLLAVKVTTSGMASSHSVTGGVYKARERIHRRMADRRLLAIPASCRRVAACNPNWEKL